jgi:hypothetical protein
MKDCEFGLALNKVVEQESTYEGGEYFGDVTLP